jgi:3-oxoacyl-[acyl-carrier-protein] synthase II
MSGTDRRVVITGLGAVTPLGTGDDALWRNLSTGKSGVRRIQAFNVEGAEHQIGAEVVDFDPKRYVQQRKTLKLMAQDIQLAMGSANLAVQSAGLDLETLDKGRFGVSFGAGLIATELSEISPAVRASVNGSRRVDLREWGREGFSHLFPLWMLKYLPNMPACHISIAYDAQGPNNTITSGEASSTLAMGEAYRVIQRGAADLFLAGGTDSKIHPLSIVRLALLGRLTKRNDDPAGAMRPFDRRRDGTVPGEGSAVCVFEEWEHARRRGANIRGEVLGFGAYCDPGDPVKSIAAAVDRALREAKLNASDLGHVSAMGVGGVAEDRVEALALARVLGSAASTVPITAYKSMIGNAAAASGAVETAASLLAVEHGLLPAVLNFEELDPDLPPLRILKEAIECPSKPFVTVARSHSGQCAALVVGPFAGS